MALAYNSQTFRDARGVLEQLSKERKITKQDVIDVSDSFGISPKDFKNANKDFKKFKELGEDEPSLVKKYALAPIGRAVGDAVGGLAMLSKAAAKSTLSDEAYKDLSKALNSTAAYIPDSVKRAAQATFDPYHGEGITGDISELTGQIGSYFIPGGIFTKAGKGLMTSKNVAPHVGVAMSKLSSRGQKLAKGGGYGLAATGAVTVIEDPRQNTFDTLYAYLSGNEDAMAKLSEYEKNPDDPALRDYFSAFLKNAAVEVPLGAGLNLLAIDPILKVMGKYRQGKQFSKPKTSVLSLGQGKEKAKGGGKFSQLFTANRGTDDATLESVIKRERAATASYLEADGIAKDLKELVETELGDKIKQNPKYVSDVIDMALKGDAAAQQTLRNDSSKVFNAVSNMRKEIDNLSKELANSGVASNELVATITKKGSKPGAAGLETYVTRSYQIFENPEVRKAIQKRVKNRIPNANPNQAADIVVEKAAHYIAKTLGKSYDDIEVQSTLMKLVKAEDKSVLAEFLENIANKGHAKMTGKPLYQRKEVPSPIRDLYSEVKDPYQNFTNTYQKLSVINANNKFMEEMAVSLQNKFNNRVQYLMDTEGLTKEAATFKAKDTMVDAGQAGADVLGPIVGERKLANNAIKNPLQGVYADDAYVNFVRNGLNLKPSDNKLLETWALSKGLAQKGKTVYNPGTHAKNIAGNAVMLGANGILPKGTNVVDALSTYAKMLTKENNTQLGKRMAKYDRLGITSSDLGLGEIRANTKKIGADANKWLESTVSGKAEKALNVAKKGDEYITRLYQAEDDFFKIIHFEYTKDYLKKAYPNLAEDVIEGMAAQRTRDMMPNYNLVPTAIKQLRYAPVGNFVAFPAEMARITKNLGKYTLKDLGSESNVLKTEGAKRLAGITVVGTAPTALSMYSMYENDIDDDDNQVIEMIGAPYNINTEKFYTSKLNRDKNGHIGVDYYNLSAYDPFHYVKAIAKNTHDIIALGMSPEESSYELNKTALATLDQTLGPFLGVDMITQAALDIMQGKTAGGDEPELKDMLAASMRPLLEVADPGIFRFLKRREQYETSGMTEYGTTIPDGSTDAMNYLTGVKKERADITGGMRFNFNPAFSKAKNARRQMTQVINDPNKVDPNEIFKEFVDMQKVKRNAFRDVKSMLELYQRLGYTIPDIVQDLSGDNKYPVDDFKVELLQGAEQNYFVPDVPPTSEALVRKPSVPYNAMNSLYEKLIGQRID